MALGNKKSLSSKSKVSSSVSKVKSGKETEVLKSGEPLDNSVKRSSVHTVGASVGSTLNMGNYESLRIECWVTRPVTENETEEEVFEDIYQTIDREMSNLYDKFVKEDS